MEAANADSDCRVLDEELGSLQRQIAGVEADLAQKKLICANLLARRQEIGLIRSQRLFRHFPTEIVLRILEIEILSITSPTSREYVTNQLRLVCSTWNDTILGAPGIWSTITFIISNRHLAQWMGALERANARAERLATIQNLHIEIFKDYKSKVLPEEVASFAYANAHKVQILTFYSANNDHGPLLQLSHRESSRIKWSVLRSIKVILPDQPHHSGLGPLKTRVSHDFFPRLKEVDMGGPAHQNLLQIWGMPWDRLSTLKLTVQMGYWASYLHLLRPCVSLQHLHIELTNQLSSSSPYTFHPWPRPTDALQQLQSLSLKVSLGAESGIFNHFVYNLVLPSLRSFEYASDIHHKSAPGGPIEYIMELFERSSCTSRIESLSLRFVSCSEWWDPGRHPWIFNSDAILARFLRTMPELRRFALSSARMSCDFLVGRTTGTDDELTGESLGVWLPSKLEELEIGALQPSRERVEENFRRWATVFSQEKERLRGQSKGGSRTRLTLRVEELVTKIEI